MRGREQGLSPRTPKWVVAVFVRNGSLSSYTVFFRLSLWRAVFVGLLVWSGVFGLFGIAQANNGPHGSYTKTTDKCGGCHRTHTGGQPNLLKGSTVSELCLSCHDGSGANTNVWDGLYEPNGTPLNRGGLRNLKGSTVTCSHSYDGSQYPAWGADTPWQGQTGCLGCHSHASGLRWPGIPEFFPGVGSQPGQVPGAGNVQMALTCVRCHDPHGARSYRLLNNRVMADVVEYQDPTLPSYIQVISNETGGLNPDQPGYLPLYTEKRYRDGITSWCASGHYLYQQTQSQPGVPFDAADGSGAQIRYRHAMGLTPATTGLTTTLPLQQPAGYSATPQPTDKVACLTCHYAHGSNPQMIGYAANVAPANDSALLRLDNRGVCEDCHKK